MVDFGIGYWARMLGESSPGGVDEAEAIADDAAYLDCMSKSFGDKAWFAPFAPPGLSEVVDFGGGTGDFLEFARGRLGAKAAGASFAVVDNNSSFLSRAAAKGFGAYGSLDEYAEARKGSPAAGPRLLVMSSVIHEVYSYADEIPGGVAGFWESLGRCGFDYVAVRDMSLSDADYASVPVASAVWAYENVFRNRSLSVKGVPLPELLSSFEEVWGPVADPDLGAVDVRNLVHFLAKYRYVENWAREVREDYFPVTQAELAGEFSRLGYSLPRRDSSRLPFYYEQWSRDFGLRTCPREGRPFAKWLSRLNTHIKWLAAR